MAVVPNSRSSPTARSPFSASSGMIHDSYQWFRPGGRFGAGAIADQLAGISLDGIGPRP